ncbi:MAG: hypothetical protein AVDCRST_MAG68-1540, partial [uncultured Gemmatimonadetes bacterium]
WRQTARGTPGRRTSPTTWSASSSTPCRARRRTTSSCATPSRAATRISRSSSAPSSRKTSGARSRPSGSWASGSSRGS